ncbi:Aspartate/glutamate/uridylate kinase [Corchorus capsularis]|uniref:UMP kinase n=1 Tax=Corchorus capsularis TaxID=210143 RepID=A0A1R3IHE3_COCAP|nr:Aspartate/glutamate/uridylate kinase [Corchorus capsularis]
MASSVDDDFSLLDDHQTNPNHQIVLHHHHPSYAPIQAPTPDNHDADDDSDSNFRGANFGNNNNATSSDVRIEKRRDQEEINDSGSKRHKQSTAEYRKDREEWSDAAIGCLLEAYLEKLTQLNRGNLRGRDWEEVAAAVTERCEKQSKSVEQCKNKVDNLKKRYKLERHRMTDGGITASHWPWFKKMEEIVGNSQPGKAAPDEEKGSASPATSVRQSKRYASATPSPGGQIISTKSKSPKWKRVVFKISGAALACTGPHNIDPKVAVLIAREVAIACRLGVEVAIVVGGRNFFCGDSWVTATGLERSTAYQIGMMASVMNSVLLQSSLEKMGVQTRVQTAFSVPEVAEPYSRQRAIRHLEKGRVVIFGGIGAGTGNPLFSTDTAAALRASEIHAEAVLKGTNVDGVYDCHSQDNNATFEHITFRELVSRGAAAMDMMALTFCEENNIPDAFIVVVTVTMCFSITTSVYVNLAAVFLQLELGWILAEDDAGSTFEARL